VPAGRGTPDRFSSTDPEDREDIARTLDGDPSAFTRLFRRHRERAYWIAFHLLGNAEDAREVVQEAFLRVHRSLDRFDRARPFPAWLYRIVTNLAIDRRRRGGRLRTVPLPRGAGATLGAPQDGPAELLDRKETRRRVREILEELPPKYRTALVLRELEGFGIEEIALIAKTSLTAMRWRVHRARCLFREEWESRRRRTRP
jgi:RNA polymerase sigma-70 factor (ECF subfamily)